MEAIWGFENIFHFGGSGSWNLSFRGSREAGLAGREHPGWAPFAQDELRCSGASARGLQGEGPAAWREGRPRFAQISTKSIQRKNPGHTRNVLWSFL